MLHAAAFTCRSLLAAVVAVVGLALGVPDALAKPPGGGGGGGGTPLPRWLAVPLDPAPNDADVMYILAMNDHGDLCGYFADGVNPQTDFLRLHNGDGTGTFVDLQTVLDPAAQVHVYEFAGLSNVGQLVFFGSVNDRWGIYRLTLPPAGDTYGTLVTVIDQNVGPTGYGNLRINDFGSVIGDADVYAGGVYLGYRSFAYTDANGLDTLDGAAAYASFTGLNNAGQASGAYVDGSSYAVRYTLGLGAETFTDPSSARGINAGGDMAGYIVRSGNRKAFLFTDAGLAVLPTLGGSYGEARAINVDRYVVGYSSTSGKRGASVKPFVYHPSFGTIDLTNQIDSLPSGTASVGFPSFGQDKKLVTDGRHILVEIDTLGPCLLVPVP